MPRPPGRRNQDFEQKRIQLLEKLTTFVLSEGVEMPSFRQLAIAADTSEPTLRHYFHDRSGVIVALIKRLSEITEPTWSGRTSSGDTVDETVAQFIDQALKLQRNPVYARGHAFCIRESMSDTNVQQAFLEYIVEPYLDLFALRLMKTEGGPSSVEAAKAAAKILTSSSLFVVMHQKLLGGENFKPMDVDGYFEFVRTWMLSSMKMAPTGLVQHA
ncbi:MAG: hypothetical protein VX593_02475 [Pseudomonadota bacterium]|nr:hypothetical protein [Pseudomonadota bacterium]